MACACKRKMKVCLRALTRALRDASFEPQCTQKVTGIWLVRDPHNPILCVHIMTEQVVQSDQINYISIKNSWIADRLRTPKGPNLTLNWKLFAPNKKLIVTLL